MDFGFWILDSVGRGSLRSLVPLYRRLGIVDAGGAMLIDVGQADAEGGQNAGVGVDQDFADAKLGSDGEACCGAAPPKATRQ